MQLHPLNSLLASRFPQQKPLQAAMGLKSKNDLLEPSFAALKFGRVANLVEMVFKPITEDYFWGFLARDILGLWAPRIVNSLARGRLPYEPKSDPLYGKRGVLEQWVHQTKATIRGLNFWNGWEETAREIQSGPGWMVAHAALFGVSMLQMTGKRALMMSHNELKHFFGLLGLSLSGKELEQFHRLPAQTQRELMLKSFLKKALGPNLNVAHRYEMTPDKILHLKNRFASQSEKTLADWVQSEFGQKLRKGPIQYDEILDRWIHHYTQIFKKTTPQKVYLPKLLKLENIFEELVDQINTRSKFILDPMDVSAIRIQSALNPKETVRMSAQGFLNALNKFSTALGEVSKRIHPSQPLDSASFKGILERLRREVVQRKFVLSPVATILGGVLAFYVAAISQSEKRSYPANRLIPLPKHPIGSPLEAGND